MDKKTSQRVARIASAQLRSPKSRIVFTWRASMSALFLYSKSKWKKYK